MTEYAVKLAASGAVNLAALLIAILRNQKQIAGKTEIMNLMQDGKPLTAFPLAAEKMKDFSDLAKKYGIMFSIVRDKNNPETVDVIIREEDAQRVNAVREKIGATAEVPDEKKANASLSESELMTSRNTMQHGLASTKTTIELPQVQMDSLLSSLHDIRAALDHGADPEQCQIALRGIQNQLADMLGLPDPEKTAARDTKDKHADGREKTSLKHEKKPSRSESKQSVRSKIANMKERMAHDPQHLKPKAPQVGKHVAPSMPDR